jgi:hypothetical protein
MWRRISAESNPARNTPAWFIELTELIVAM